MFVVFGGIKGTLMVNVACLISSVFAAACRRYFGFVFLAAAAFSAEAGVYTNRVVDITDVWKYNVDYTDLGTAWSDPAYSDADWSSGGGLLYVESSDLPAAKTTALPVSKPMPLTSYFRIWFTNDLAGADSVSLTANTVIDDGLVLYLNGTEILRNGIAAGTVSYSTLATNVGDAVYAGPFVLDAAALEDGPNLLAAEVHQSGETSSDVCLGLTLDLVWTGEIEDILAPEIVSLNPAADSVVTNLTQVTMGFDEDVSGVDASDLLINGTAASGLSAASASQYTFSFVQPDAGVVSMTWASGHGITDTSENSNPFAGAGFSYLQLNASEHDELPFASVYQSSDDADSSGAENAVDLLWSTYSLTQDLPGSYWMAELGRPYEISRIEIVNRTAPDDAELAGLTLTVENMDDQAVYEEVLTNPGSGAALQINLPAGTVGRSVRIGLSGSETNGAGNQRVGLTEVRVLGDAQIEYMPEPYVAEEVEFDFAVWQSTDYSSSYPADNAVDGDTDTFSHTDTSTADNYWIADMFQERVIDSVDLVDRSYSDLRMEGYTLYILDDSMEPVASTVTTDPGSGGTFTYTPPAGTAGRYVKVCLENGDKNGKGDTAIQLAEVKVWSGGYNVLTDSSTTIPPVTDNLAQSQTCYMLRLHDYLEPAENVNDGDMTTEAVTTSQTVDGYWEVDLGDTYALYGVRAVSASDVGDRLTNAVCRLFDENHDSVLEKNVSGFEPSFDVDLDGPVFARYVRVGYEDKTRTDGSPGGYLGFREIEVFGRDADEVGILSFSASDTEVSAGGNVTLSWTLEDVKRAEIFPAVGSVGSYTETNGIGSLEQILSASMEFILTATNNAGLFTSAVGVEVDGDPLPVVISEIVADSKYSLDDGYGDASDWIEIRNTGNSSVDLTGWGLSDNPSNPMKWIFPATNIAPHEAMIIFASGEETSVDPAGFLHADFSLGKSGETVQLTAADGSTVLDQIVFPALDEDLAYGRDLEGNWTFMEPTPGAVNTGETYDGWMDSLDWSHARGFYETNFTLTVTSDDPEAVILYSLDGTAPSVPYTNGLSITGTSVVRIQSSREGFKPSSTQTKSFIFLDDVIANSNMDTDVTQDTNYAGRIKPGLLALPTISLVVDAEGEAIDAVEYDEQACSLEILWPDGGNPIQEDCGISRYGGAYSYFEKKAFSLAFRQKYGAGKLDAPLFNGFDRGTLVRTSFDRLHLRGGNHDWTRSFGMSDRFIQDSYLDMGSLNPHGRFVHVYLNGEYWGQYNCKEVLNEAFLADYLGGDEEDYISVKGNQNQGGWVIGAGDPPVVEPWELVRELRTDYEAVSPYLDMSHFIDFMLLWSFGGAENEFRACGPRTAGSGFKFWINDPDGFIRDNYGVSRINSTSGPGYIWSGLHSEAHVDFMILLADRIYKNFFNDGAMTGSKCIARLESRMDEVRDSFIAECARWNRSYTWWEGEAEDAYENYFPTWSDQLVEEWRSIGFFPSFDPPTFSQYGGLVTEGYQPTLTSADGTIYYSTDGTDPREPGGGLSTSSSISVWTAGAVTVTEDVTITCRVRTTSGEWSALAEPRYLLGSRTAPQAGELLITEVNYNPDGPDDYEFIEIWNSSTNLIDLNGVTIDDGVYYIFSEDAVLLPGGFVVVAEDSAAFSNRYQDISSPWYWSDMTVDGEWVGGLSDSGETVTLVSSNGTALVSVTYDSSGDWPSRADGGGSSLQLAEPSQAPDDPTELAAFLADGNNWSASLLYHGSPGRFESVDTSVIINEVLSHTDVGVDWIELYNTGSSAADLSGWALTDDLDWPNRYLLPDGTEIEAGGYLTVSAADLGFGFSELGSDAALLQVDGSNAVAIIDQVEFPAAAREEPFGRHERSDGEIMFTELSAVTPGASNAAPRVGPVVISEIMYAPAAGFAPYVELMNISGAAVPLYDESIPTNVWTFTGTGGFSFPTGTVMQAGEAVVLCATNPAVFRAQYGVDEAVQVFGPWPGGLDAEGEMLKLLSPGDPEPDGFVPMYRADYVSFGTNGYWPAVTGTGTSIERYSVFDFGNDPAHWQASDAFATPGFGTEYLEPFVSSIASASGEWPTIGFPALYGQSYEIQYTDSLTDPDWQTLGVVYAASGSWVEVVDDSASANERFYRIVLLGFVD